MKNATTTPPRMYWKPGLGPATLILLSLPRRIRANWHWMICLFLLGLCAAVLRTDGEQLFSMHGHATKVRAGKPDHADLSPSQTVAHGNQPLETRSLKAYGKLPLSFEVNRGQTDSRVMFLSRGRGYTLFLTGNEAVLSLKKKYVAQGSHFNPAAFRMAQRSLFNAGAFQKSPAPRSSPSEFNAALSLNSFRSSVVESDSNSALHTPATPAAETVLHMKLRNL